VVGVGGIFATALAEQFDPVSDTWSNIAPPLAPVQLGMAATVAGKLYVFGGGADLSVTQALTPPRARLRKYALGGTVQGLTTAGLVLRTQDQADLAVAANAGAFTFGARVTPGSSYEVSVAQQPSGQTCTVAGGSGVVGWSDVTSIRVTCVDPVLLTVTARASSGSQVPTGTYDCNPYDCGYWTYYSCGWSTCSSYVPRTCWLQCTSYTWMTSAFTITSSPPGLTCSVPQGGSTSTCAAAFPPGTSVTLLSNGTTFTGDCAGAGSCTVLMDEARSTVGTH
jgi:hypothetical protein